MIGNGQIKRIELLVKDLRDKEIKIKELEIELSEVKAKKRELEEEIIPDVMRENDLTALSLSSGLKIEVKPFYYARVDKDKADKFYDWLRSNNHGSLIKSHYEVWTSSPKVVELLMEFSKQFEITYECGETIHWKTLESWFKEQHNLNNKIPYELFQNHVGSKAVVK